MPMRHCRICSFFENGNILFFRRRGGCGRAVGQVDAIKEYIYHHLDSDIRREDIAVAVFMNPNYVSRLFKKVEGISLKEFIVQEKMKMARALLLNSQLPVSIVALKVGYSNFSHFSQVYRKFLESALRMREKIMKCIWEYL